jgi:hypothetical protein
MGMISFLDRSPQEVAVEKSEEIEVSAPKKKKTVKKKSVYKAEE